MTGDDSLPIDPRVELDDSDRSVPDNVEFIGVYAQDERLRHTHVPDQYQCHALVRDLHFYTVPHQLLHVVIPSETNGPFESDEDLVQMEVGLSEISGDHSSIVGFWNSRPINCNLLFSTPVTRDQLPNLEQLTNRQIDEKLRVINERLLGIQEITCAYSGWLMQNRDFVTELTDLTSSFGNEIARWGTEFVGLPLASTHPLAGMTPVGEPGWPTYERAVLDFCIRWRLHGLAGPRIPVPMRPMMSGQFPVSILQQLMRAGGVFNWPDTFPLYARDQLRDLISDALRSNPSNSHLEKWLEIISASNKSKNQFASYERQFRLQHFWRLLRERHPAAFVRRLSRIEFAFADYFGVSEATLRNDRDKLRARLGNDWDILTA